MAYDNTNGGALFKNDRKEKDSQPDYRGNLDVCGVSYWISGWIKNSKEGKRYMSLAIQPKAEDKYIRPRQEDLDDEIPF